MKVLLWLSNLRWVKLNHYSFYTSEYHNGCHGLWGLQYWCSFSSRRLSECWFGSALSLEGSQTAAKAISSSSILSNSSTRSFLSIYCTDSPTVIPIWCFIKYSILQIKCTWCVKTWRNRGWAFHRHSILFFVSLTPYPGYSFLFSLSIYLFGLFFYFAGWDLYNLTTRQQLKTIEGPEHIFLSAWTAYPEVSEEMWFLVISEQGDRKRETEDWKKIKDSSWDSIQVYLWKLCLTACTFVTCNSVGIWGTCNF